MAADKEQVKKIGEIKVCFFRKVEVVESLHGKKRKLPYPLPRPRLYPLDRVDQIPEKVR